MKKLITIWICLLMFSITFSCGCLDFIFPEWECDHYYYADIYYKGNETFVLKLPIPENTKIIKKLSLITGNATFNIIEMDYGKFLKIKGNSSVSLNSYFENFDMDDMDSYLNGGWYNLYCNKQINISVIIESRKLYRQRDDDLSDFYYGGILQGNISNIEIDELSWKEHLPQGYSVNLTKGWCHYNYQSGEANIL